MEGDTIAAISTPVGEGAISIVRLSGPQAIPIVNRIFSGKDLEKVASHTLHYGKITDPDTGAFVDEVIVSVMRAPKTFTVEDVVEINGHGGMVAVQDLLQVVLKEGARLAEPGEFTKRAFLNGRIDLSQAEAVMDVIASQTNKAKSLAMNQLEGRLSQLIRNLRQHLIETIAQVEVNIDYPEYDDVEEMTHDLMEEKTAVVLKEIDHLLEVAKQGKILREGVRTAIVGRPNVGKSSLLNALAQEEKAIVTDIAGTTRDVIEEYVNVRGIPLRLMDTAGIRETDDLVERIGVEKSREILSQAELTLFMLNNHEALSTDDRQIFDLLKDEAYIVIINKMDLANHLNIDEVRELAGERQVIELSLKEAASLTALEDAIENLFMEAGPVEQDQVYVSNVRHIHLLQQARDALVEAREGLALQMPLDIVQIDVRRSWEYLGEIIGDTASESLIDQLFSQFCLGK